VDSSKWHAVPEGEEGMLVAGPSDAGLADPIQLTAISLTIAWTALLTSHPSLDALMATKCMLIVTDDIQRALFEPERL
jgi:hypothetical protein